MTEGLLEERGSEDLAAVAIQARSRLRPAQDVLGSEPRVGRCDAAGPGEHLRQDLAAEPGHVPRIRIVAHCAPLLYEQATETHPQARGKECGLQSPEPMGSRPVTELAAAMGSSSVVVPGVLGEG